MRLIRLCSAVQSQSEERPASAERGEQQPRTVDHQLHVEPKGHSDHGDRGAQRAAVRRGDRVAQLQVRGGAPVAAPGGLRRGGGVGRGKGGVDRPVRDGGVRQRDQLDVGRDGRRGRRAQGRPAPGRRVQGRPAPGRRVQTLPAADGRVGRMAQIGQAVRGRNENALLGRRQRRAGRHQAQDIRTVRDTQGRHRGRTSDI